MSSTTEKLELPSGDPTYSASNLEQASKNWAIWPEGSNTRP
jgi:hypothetical protein